MSSFNMEDSANYITRLSEEERIIFLRALVSLARADDNFDEDEKNFIRDIAVIFGIPQNKADLVLTPLADLFNLFQLNPHGLADFTD